MSDVSAYTESGSPNPLSAVYERTSPVLRRFQESIFSSLAEMRKAANQVAFEVKSKFSDQPEELVEGVLDLTLGFLRLDQDTLVKEGIKPDIYQRELSARLQHTYSDLIVKASEGDDPALSTTMYDVLKNWHKVKHQRVFSQGALPILWRGMESQIATMRALRGAGYKVTVPDYTQQDVDDSENEVLQFDVKSGVDMLAEKNGVLLLVDAKGRINQGDSKLDNAHEVDPNFEPNALVREKIHSLNPRKVIRTKIFVPSDTRSFVSMPSMWPSEVENPSAFLNNFGRLRPEHEVPLVNQLERIERSARPIDRRFA